MTAKSLFVTSSGTDIGKTHICCRLIERLEPRMRLRCIKPVVTGFDAADPSSSDTARLIRAQGMVIDTESIDATSPWRFREPLSADMAAAREGRTVPFEDLQEFCRPSADNELNLIEGIGGVMAPIDETHTVLDWIEALDTDVLLVVGSYLGSLSHSMTAVRTLNEIGRAPIAIVISQSDSEPVPTQETAASLARHCRDVPVVIEWRHNRHGAEAGLEIVERQLAM